MHQLPLLRAGCRSVPTRVPLDPMSEALLDRYRAARIAAGAHVRSVAREVSQLRSVAREAGREDAPMPLADLITDMRAIAHALCEPRAEISRATGRARLLAIQRCLGSIGPMLGRDPSADLRVLDALLPAQPQRGWHDTGTLVAGTSGHRRQRGPTLSAADLGRIVAAVGYEDDAFRSARDRALVALHCFSGLHAEEIIGLRWEDLSLDGMEETVGLIASVGRGRRHLDLPILGAGVEALRCHAEVVWAASGSCAGVIFRKRPRQSNPLSYRASRAILMEACRKAGLPPVESAALRAAYAYWLRSRGLSDHEVAAALGIARVRSLDQLLARHAALNAQRTVREWLG
jgi:integrase